MDSDNEYYWYNLWFDDLETHKKLFINSVSPINLVEPVSIYGDTDSLFVSFKPAMDHCEWLDQIFNKEYLSKVKPNTIILSKRVNIPYNVETTKLVSTISELVNLEYDTIIVDGNFVKDREFNKLIDSGVIKDVIWNWSCERDFIQGFDKLKFANYFKEKLDQHAAKYGVLNKEDFELERISESIINIAKKKYIQNITHEDGIDYDRLKYIYPKGVELIRSSTPAFAREKIIDIVKYLFESPDNFNIKELLKLVKTLRKEFELADIDDICMQSSVSNYNTKVIEDRSIPLKFVSGAHFAVKSSAYHNYLLSQNMKYQHKYDFIKSGNKIKYYTCKDKSINDMFAYTRGSFPFEIAPEVDYDIQFAKSILSPINSIIEPLGMPKITERLKIAMDIFFGY